MTALNYKRYFTIHERTGVLYTYISPMPTFEEAEKWAETHLCEPNHIMVQGEIDDDIKKRKRGVWQYSDDKRLIYFSCPWCGAIGMTGLVSYVGSKCAESIFCGYPRSYREETKVKGCGRHLTLSYRLPGKEEDNHFPVQF